MGCDSGEGFDPFTFLALVPGARSMQAPHLLSPDLDCAPASLTQEAWAGLLAPQKKEQPRGKRKAWV